jgi:hypothetical protein
LRSGKREDNQVVDLEANHAEPEADHAKEEKPKGEEDDNQKEKRNKLNSEYSH